MFGVGSVVWLTRKRWIKMTRTSNHGNTPSEEGSPRLSRRFKFKSQGSGICAKYDKLDLIVSYHRIISYLSNRHMYLLLELESTTRPLDHSIMARDIKREMRKRERKNNFTQPHGAEGHRVFIHIPEGRAFTGVPIIGLTST